MKKYLWLMLSVLLTLPSLLYAAETLVFAIDIIRHGDRTPLIQLPTPGYQWSEGLGQLTPRGMQQEFQLGTALRKKYVEQSQLLPEKYQYGSMYARSTDYDRTLMSAQSLLTGLYPPGTGPMTVENASPALPHAIMPIPVFSAPRAVDDMIAQPVSAQEHRELMEKYVYTNVSWQEKHKALMQKYPRWSELTGVPIHQLDDLIMVADALYIHRLYKAPMPEDLSQEEISEIIEAGQWAFSTQLASKDLANVYSGKLMRHVGKYLNNASNAKNKLKFVLLSAHDSTLGYALSFLGAPLLSPPPYASNLQIGLYLSSDNNYLVKLRFNNTPVTIPSCGGESCELSEFMELVQTNQPALA